MGSFLLSQPYGTERAQQVVLTGTNPAAGVSFTLTTDAAYVWRLVGLMFTLTTDGNAANRYVSVEYLDGGGVSYFADAAAVTVSASSTQRFVGSAERGVAEWAANTDVLFPLTPLYLRDGARLKVNVAAIQAGDTLTLIRLVADRFFTDESQYLGYLEE